MKRITNYFSRIKNRIKRLVKSVTKNKSTVHFTRVASCALFLLGVIGAQLSLSDTTIMHVTNIALQPDDSQQIAGSSGVPKRKSDESDAYDDRVFRLEQFLMYHNSPLSVHADDFVTSADRNGIDWRWIVAISGVESTFGKRIPADSYNAYGWGNGKIYFDSWEESIEVVSKSIKERYVDRGADTIAEIAPIYAPPSKTWGSKVTYFMNEIDSFSPKHSRDLAIAL